MTKEQKDILREMGPYAMTTEGLLLDVNGVSIGYSLTPPASGEQREWIGAVLAAVNEACADHGGELEKQLATWKELALARQAQVDESLAEVIQLKTVAANWERDFNEKAVAYAAVYGELENLKLSLAAK